MAEQYIQWDLTLGPSQKQDYLAFKTTYWTIQSHTPGTRFWEKSQSGLKQKKKDNGYQGS